MLPARGFHADDPNAGILLFQIPADAADCAARADTRVETVDLAAGLLPALRASGAVTFDLLKDEARGSSSLRIGGISRALVVGELAMACALLVATGLMIRTVIAYNDIDLGFATDSILTASLTLPDGDYPTAVETTRARGVRPSSLPIFSLPISTSADPSTMPDELPAVCT